MLCETSSVALAQLSACAAVTRESGRRTSAAHSLFCLSCLVPEPVPMLGKTPIFGSYDVGRDERRWASIAREASVNDDAIAPGEDQAVLVARAVRQAAYEGEQPPTRFNVSAVLGIFA